MRGQIGLHMMTSAGTQKLTTLVRYHVRDVLGVSAPQRLTCKQNDPDIHVVGAYLCFVIGAINKRPQAASVDLRGALVGCKKYRGLIEETSFDDHVAGAQSLALSLQMNLREYDLSAARTYINPHGRQENIVLLPERVVLQRALVKVIVMVVIVVVTWDVNVLVEYPVVMVCQSMQGAPIL